MRRVLVIGSLFGGGAEAVAMRLATAWAARGHEVHLVVLHDSADDAARVPSGVVIHALGLGGSSGGSLSALLGNAKRVRALRRTLLALVPDVVVSFLVETNVLTLAATRFTGLPVLVSERTDPRRHPLRLPWRMLRRLLYPGADALVVQTQRVAGWARAMCPPDHVHVIPNAVVPRAGELDPPPAWLPRGPFAVAVGRLSPEKGFDLLLHAFARFAQLRPEWSLVICGEGPERGRLETLGLRAGLGDRVLLPGHVRAPETVVARARLFVLPSRYEGFPNVLLEAMREGVPGVSFDCDSGPAEIVTDGVNGLLAPAGNVEALALAMARLADDASLAGRLGTAARAVVQRFAPDRILDQWEQALHGAMRVAPAPARS